MSDHLRVVGVWPRPITLSHGWAKARARPWNDDGKEAFLRLERGGPDFLRDATQHLAALAQGAVFSPAIYPSSARIWARCGYQVETRLEVWERSLSRPSTKPQVEVKESDDPNWTDIMRIDRAAFSGFWRMSLPGLQEAAGSTRRSSVLTVANQSATVGYAIVGAQWGTSYLQRIAVDPAHSGEGHGAELLRAALSFGQRAATQVMVLNVRRENTRAQSLYAREGFVPTGSSLHILRYR